MKSQLVGFTLTFLFGPFGLLYASVAWGLGLIVAAFVVGALTFGIGAVVLWPVSMLMSLLLINTFNSRAIAQQRDKDAYRQWQHDLAVWQTQAITEAARDRGVPVGKDILKEQDAIRLERWSAE